MGVIMRVGYGYDDNLRFDESVDNDMMFRTA